MPPAPAESSISSHVVSVQSSSASLIAGTQRFMPAFSPGAEMRADVEHDAVRVDRARDLHRVPQRGARLLVDLLVRRGEVDEVERVREHAAGRDAELRAALLERLEVRRIVVRRPPHPRALREELHRVGAHRLGAVERRVDAARGGDVGAEEHALTLAALSRGQSLGQCPMSVRVRMAPSPTGFLHVGTARTFLFNWLFARQQGGECLLRIENTDMNREVEGATEQIQRSLTWLGLDWDALSFQLDRMHRCQEEAQRLVEPGTRTRTRARSGSACPTRGRPRTTTSCSVTSRRRTRCSTTSSSSARDGRPTYNFASPVEDWLDGITHVLRGRDHISNTPKQINILRALGAELPLYGHMPDIAGDDGKKLSKRHGAQSLDEFRDMGYYAPALMNFLALLGWSYDDKTTIMSRDELIERFSFDRVQSSPAAFDYKKLDWMNGVYLRGLAPDEYADALIDYLGPSWDPEKVRRIAPLVQEKLDAPRRVSRAGRTSTSATTSSRRIRRCSTRRCSRAPPTSCGARAVGRAVDRGGASRSRGGARAEAGPGVPRRSAWP